MKRMATTHADEKQEEISPELAKILDDKIARADEDEKQSVPLRPAIKEDRKPKPRAVR
jgi:hypothetical protein